MKSDSPLKGLFDASMIGVHMVATTFIGLAIGYYLDKFFGTQPWLTMIFLFVGIGAGFRDIFRMIKKQNDEAEAEKEEGDDHTETG